MSAKWSPTWDGLSQEIRTKILEFTLLGMVVDFVPRAKLAKRRKTRNKKPDQTQNRFDLLCVSKSFLVPEELDKMARKFATFKFREAQQFFMLDKRFGANSVESIRHLCLSLDVREHGELGSLDEVMMPTRHFWGRLSGLQSLTVLLTEAYGPIASFDVNVDELAQIWRGEEIPQAPPDSWYRIRDRTDGTRRDIRLIVPRFICERREWGYTLEHWLGEFLTPTPEAPYERYIQFRMDLIDIWDNKRRQACLFEFGSSLHYLRLASDHSVRCPLHFEEKYLDRFPVLAPMNENLFDAFWNKDLKINI